MSSYRQTTLLESRSGLSSRNQSYTQSGLIAETSHHTLQSYGSVLPVLIIEAISEATTVHSVSVKIQGDGWCWLVCGRRLFVWKSVVSRASVSSCYELQLPPSDLSHKADLVCLIAKAPSSQIPGLIAVSPEGIVRYWPSIAYAGHSIETTTQDLQGQECFSLTNIDALGCILGTTTSSLVHVVINSGDSPNIISCRTLRIPQGVFAGLSKKVTSFIFGALPVAQGVENRPLVKILRQPPKASGKDEHAVIYVLAGSVLQKWHISSFSAESLIYEIDLDRALREAFLDFGVWNRESTHPDQLQLWQIDAEIRNEEELVLLVAGLNSDGPSHLYYVLATFKDFDVEHTHTQQMSSVEFTSFTVLRNNPIFYSPEQEERLLNLKILSIPNNQVVYVYNQVQLLCIQYERDVLDFINFGEQNNLILGAGVCEKVRVLFTSKDGLVSVISNQEFNFIEPLEAASPKVDVIGREDDLTVILRKTFAMHRRREVIKSQTVVNEKLLTESSLAEIDETVTALSTELCDEFPSSDPRWAETSASPINVITASVLLTNQLEEKLKTHQLFIDFLKNTGIWEKLSVVGRSGLKANTQMVICEHTEKIIAAVTLKRLQSEFDDILEPVMKVILRRREKAIPLRLTYQDVFYKEITKIDDIFPVLIEYEQEQISSSLLSPKHVLKALIGICSVIIVTLQEVCKFRIRCSHLYDFSRRSHSDHVPWTCSVGTNGIRSTLLKQFDLLVAHGIEIKSSGKPTSTEDEMQLKVAVHHKLVDLVDVILDGYVYQLKLLPVDSEKYRLLLGTFESDRTKCIEPLLTIRQYERAVSLAEKYEDFDILIRVCEELDNKDRLQRYMNDFADRGFSEHLFKWYLLHGKMGKMLSSNFTSLGSFLNEYKTLQWLHQIGTDQFGEASQTLKHLAANERQFVSRKKTLLSLSKLAGLASGESDFGGINKMHDLILYQQTLPAAVLQAHGLNYGSMKPLSPEELVELYISDANKDATEVDFKKAMDLTRYMSEDGRDVYHLRNIRLRILSSAILRDSWETFNTDNPLEFIKETVFFRLIDLALSQGDDISEFLPSSDLLLNFDQLQDLSKNPTFVYLIKAAYECIATYSQP